MTSIRVSAIFAEEDTFCGGKPSAAKWVAPPAGTYISCTYDRAVTKVFSEGSKFFETVAFGQVSGSFTWNFMADYDYIEPFKLAFEDYSCTSNGDGTYTHTFKKANNKRLPSFCLRIKQINRITGGPEDEVTELRGCVVQSVKLSSSAGTSQVSATLSGKFADAKTWKGDLATTDYQEYDGELWEFQCLFMGATASDSSYVSMVDSLSVGVDSGTEMLYTVCTPFAANYYEGQANFTLSVSCYSNDPGRLKLRAYTGGQSVATGSPASPWAKGLKPCADMTICSYNLSVHDGDAEDIGTAISESKRTATIGIEDCVFRTAQWPASDNSKMQEQISSAECRMMTLKVRTGIPDLGSTNSHPVDSANPT